MTFLVADNSGGHKDLSAGSCNSSAGRVYPGAGVVAVQQA